MLKVARMTRGYMYTYIIFIVNGLISIEWGPREFLFQWGALKEVIEKHWNR